MTGILEFAAFLWVVGQIVSVVVTILFVVVYVLAQE